MSNDYNVDGDDVSHIIMIANPTTPLGCVVWFVIIAVFWWCARDNEIDCSHRQCQVGRPVIVDHNCVCIERAGP